MNILFSLLILLLCIVIGFTFFLKPAQLLIFVKKLTNFSTGALAEDENKDMDDFEKIHEQQIESISRLGIAILLISLFGLCLLIANPQ